MRLHSSRFAGLLALVATLASAAASAPATIADLKTGPTYYSGRVYSNSNLQFQPGQFQLQVNAKNGSKFTGIWIGGPASGKVEAKGKFTMTGHTQQGQPSITVVLNGRLSAGGNAIVGTYTFSGALQDKGSFFMEPVTP